MLSTWWLITIIIIILVSTRLVSFYFTFPVPPYNKPFPAKKIFPNGRLKTCKYEILNLEIEKFGIPNRALVNSKNKSRNNTYELWEIFPLSLNECNVLVYSDTSCLSFVCSSNLNIVGIFSDCAIIIMEKTDLSFEQTLGSWHRRKTYDLDKFDGDKCISMTMSDSGAHIVVCNHNMIYTMTRCLSGEYVLERRLFTEQRLGSVTYPHCLNTKCQLLVTSMPMFKQTDGAVDVYKCPNGNIDSIGLFQSIISPVAAGYFGNQSAIAMCQGNTFLYVSAPFSRFVNIYGAGCVCIYSFQEEFHLFQVITCPGISYYAEDILSVLNFGLSFALSSNGMWLGIVSGLGKIYVYRFAVKNYEYELQLIISERTLNPTQAKCGVSVDNQGNVIFTDGENVYFSLLNLKIIAYQKPKRLMTSRRKTPRGSKF
jgi:hypothetical protein